MKADHYSRAAHTLVRKTDWKPGKCHDINIYKDQLKDQIIGYCELSFLGS